MAGEQTTSGDAPGAGGPAQGGVAALLAATALAALSAAMIAVSGATDGIAHLDGPRLVTTGLFALGPVAVLGALYARARTRPARESALPCGLGLLAYATLFAARLAAFARDGEGVTGALAGGPTVVGVAIALALYAGMRAARRPAAADDDAPGAGAGGGVPPPAPPGSPAVQAAVGLLVLGVLVSGFVALARSGSYRAARARSLAASGELAAAAATWAELAAEGGERGASARAALDELLATSLAQAPLPVALEALADLAARSAAGRPVADRRALGAFVAIAERRCDEDADAARAIVDLVAPFCDDGHAIERARARIGVALATRGASRSDDVRERAERAERAGDLARAAELLDGWVAPRLEALAAAERLVVEAFGDAIEETIRWAEAGGAPGEGIAERLAGLSADEKARWVEDNLGDHVSTHPPLVKARYAFEQAAGAVVPAAVDLAAVWVRIGQSPSAGAGERAGAVRRAEALLARIAETLRWPLVAHLVGRRIAWWLARDDVAAADRDYLAGWARVVGVELEASARPPGPR